MHADIKEMAKLLIDTGYALLVQRRTRQGVVEACSRWKQMTVKTRWVSNRLFPLRSSLPPFQNNKKKKESSFGCKQAIASLVLIDVLNLIKLCKIF